MDEGMQRLHNRLAKLTKEHAESLQTFVQKSEMGIIENRLNKMATAEDFEKQKRAIEPMV